MGYVVKINRKDGHTLSSRYIRAATNADAALHSARGNHRIHPNDYRQVTFHVYTCDHSNPQDLDCVQGQHAHHGYTYDPARDAVTAM